MIDAFARPCLHDQLRWKTSRHVGHADILREHLDGRVDADTTQQDPAFWHARHAIIDKPPSIICLHLTDGPG